MKGKINGGIYEMDLKGTNDAEFNGVHPVLIMQSIKNRDMYYIIPLTTYTKDRWANYRKNYCCRIVTTNSIARLDKTKIMHKDEIHNRWIKNEIFLIPTVNELRTVLKKYNEYMLYSSDLCVKEYKKYHKNYLEVYKMINNYFNNHQHSDNITYTTHENSIIFSFNLNLVSHLTFDDVKHIVWSIVGKDAVFVRYDKDKKLLIIEINIYNKIALTVINKYDSINLTKGQHQ